MKGRTLAAIVGVAIVALGASTSESRTTRALLPSERAIVRAEIAAESVLRGGRGPERTLPGPVSNTERVLITITPGDELVSVTVDQVLEMRGTGDYFIKIPGPVKDVEALPTSDSQPGLRAGSVVWQGFGDRRTRLGARIVLGPGREESRLPLAVTVGHNKRGVVVKVRNSTASVMRVPTGQPQSRSLKRAVGGVRGALQHGRRPVPGSHGIPKAVRVDKGAGHRAIRSIAPLQVKVTLKASGTKAKRQTWHKTLADGRPHTARFRLRGTDGEIPDLTVIAKPALPPAKMLGGRHLSARERFRRLVGTLAAVAQLHYIDGYLGNPDRKGPSQTTYRWKLVAAPERNITGPPLHPPSGTNWTAVAVVIALGLLMLLGAAVAWSLA